MMGILRVNVYAQPTSEPVSLYELKLQLSQSSGTLVDNTTLYTSISAVSHPITTGYTLLGTAIDVLGHSAVCYVSPTSVGTGGTVDVRISECDTETGTYTPWASSAFTQISAAAGNTTTRQEQAYTGAKRWIRLEAKTLVAACVFGCEIMVYEPITTEDTMMLEDIETARREVESDLGRKIISQTIDYYPQYWPADDRIKLPFGNLVSVTSISYKDTAGTETTMVAGTDYLVETNGEQPGFIVLPYSETWPSSELYPSNPIKIRYIAGWTSASVVPSNIKRAIKNRAVNLYMNRGDDIVGQTVVTDKTYNRILNSCSRLYDCDFL
jgi:uncharacterized phiE125 gp8 family phage protein